MSSGQATKKKQPYKCSIASIKGAKPHGNYFKKLSENTWCFGSWIENKVNTMHVLELAIGFTQQSQLKKMVS